MPISAAAMLLVAICCVADTLDDQEKGSAILEPLHDTLHADRPSVCRGNARQKNLGRDRPVSGERRERWPAHGASAAAAAVHRTQGTADQGSFMHSRAKESDPFS